MSLKVKIAEVFNEPACDKNRGKDETTRRKGCSKPLTPGAAAGGCAFDGAKIVLQPVTDAAHLIHGPLACEGNSWDNRHSASSGPDLYRRSFTTDLTELDIVMGQGEKKLFKAIRSIVETHAPPAIFVYSTCVTALIGDDIEAVCARAGERFGLPVIAVDAPGFAGSKNLGNKLAGEVLIDKVIGTIEPDDAGPTDVAIVGEYNIVGEFWFVKPLLDELGIRVRAVIPGDARYRDIATAHRAKATMMVCSTALINVARKLEERWGIPFFEGSFYGIADTSAALRGLSSLLVRQGADAGLLDRTEALIAREEAIARSRLAAIVPRIAGAKVLLNTGGVKSWSMIGALQELGLEVVRSSVKKSTEEDKARALARLADEKHLFDSLPPREIYRLLESGEADIMLSGSRTQFIALKARKPWLDVNQERHHPYAGYEGMIEFARRIDLALNNPVFAAVRRPPPWDETGHLADADETAADAVVHSFRRFAGATLEDSDDC
jgi:nitrogenase molybdenum-cofactor synthesis protein NifE